MLICESESLVISVSGSTWLDGAKGRKRGRVTELMYRCGGAVGIFIDIRRWLLLYLYAGSGSFATMPYLDAHGELDINMR